MRINKKSTISLQDKEILAIAFGFRDSREAQSFETENEPLQRQLVETYSLNLLSAVETLYIAWINVGTTKTHTKTDCSAAMTQSFLSL